MRFLEALIHRKVFVILVSLFIIGAGIYTFIHVERELNPDGELDGASIDIQATDTPIEDMEKDVTIPIEDQLQKITGVKDVTSTTTAEKTSFQVQFDDGKGKEVFTEVEAKVHFLLSDTPDIEQVNIQQAGAGAAYEFILDIADGDMEEMATFAEETLQPRLEKLPEVQEVRIDGMEEQQITIAFNEQALQQHQVQPSEIIPIIQELNQVETIGETSENGSTYDVQWNGQLKNVADVENVHIPTEAGPITLDDVATVSKKTADVTTDTWKNGSSDVLMIQVARTDNASQQAMTTAVRKEIDDIEAAGLIKNMTLNEVIAHADFVDDAIDDVTTNIMIGGIIAVVVLLLFLRNVRATIIISISIPTSIFLTMIAMGILDYSLNLMTLIGLGLGIGMMVDASIVMLEAIYSKKAAGLDSVSAIIAAMKEVATAIIASALTTIVVFLPIGFIGGDAGKLMMMLAIVVATTLISSVVIAFTIIPTFATDFLRISKRKQPPTPKPRCTLTIYKKVLHWTLQKKLRSFGMVTVFIVLFALSFLLVPKIPMNVMPDIFDRYTEVAIDVENGITDEEKQSLVQKANEKLQQIEDIEANFLLDLDEVLMASIVMTNGEDITKDQEHVIDDIVQALRDLQTELPIRAVERALDGVSDYPVHIEIAGEDQERLREISDEVQAEIEAIDGIVGMTNDMDNNTKVKQVKLDDTAIEEAGLTSYQVKQQLEERLLHEAISTMELADESFPVYATHELDDSVLNEMISTSEGEKELATFASFTSKEIPEEMTRKNGERYQSLMADIKHNDLGSVNQAVQEVLQQYDETDDVTVSLAGDLEEQEKLMNDILLAIGVALLLVYVVMAVQFNHFGHPFIVMAIIPITVIGVFVGLFITQAELNMMSGMGLIILIGIVLNNAILLIDRTNQLRKTGTPVIPALVEAGECRVRPILMTTLTTIGGMLPLALATGMSADYQAPMAIVIISGLLFSTLITLILIPAIYRLCSRGE